MDACPVAGGRARRKIRDRFASVARSVEEARAMATDQLDTEELLDCAGQGDGEARQQLLARHRHRLRQMVTVRLDRRRAARRDPSDIVQEALADAARVLDDYLRDRPVPFYAWLRQFAWERLVEAYRRHLQARRR